MARTAPAPAASIDRPCSKYAASVSIEGARPAAAAGRPGRPAAGGRGRPRPARARGAGRRCDRTWGLRPARGGTVGRQRRRGADGGHGSGRRPRSHHDRTLTEVVTDRARRPSASLTPPRTTTSRSPWVAHSASMPAARAAGVRRRTGRSRCAGRHRAEHHGHVAAGAPAERAGAGEHGLVGLGPQHGVDDERLEAGVPGAADLGRPGIDLGRREGDLAAVAQDRVVHVAGVARGRGCRRCCSRRPRCSAGPGRRSAAGR